MIVRIYLIALATLAMLTPAFAQDASIDDRLSLTIYNQDLALVRRQIDLDLKRGRNAVDLPGVTERLIPESAIVEANGIRLIEQNFDYDLLSPATLLARSIGKEVWLYRENPTTGVETKEKGVVRSVERGLVLQFGDRVEIMSNIHKLPGRLVFPEIPSALSARPVLSTVLEATRMGKRRGALSYLTRGLSWRADYIGRLDKEHRRLSLQGLVTLVNTTSVDFAEAEVQLVAGQINNADYRQRPADVQALRTSAESRLGKPVQREEVGEYHLYTLPSRTDVKSRQTKQVAFMQVETIEVVKEFRYRPAGLGTNLQPANPSVVIRAKNQESNGLGIPLPSGIMRFYETDSEGRPQFVGSDRVPHSAKGRDLMMTIGQAFDIGIVSIQNSTRRLGPQIQEVEHTYRVSNAKASSVDLIIEQTLWGETEILSESVPSRRISADRVEWIIEVKPEDTEELTFSLRVKR